MEYNEINKLLINKLLLKNILIIGGLVLYFWQSILLSIEQTQSLIFLSILIVLLISAAIRFLFRKIHDWKDIELILLLVIVINMVARTNRDVSSPWLYLHYLVVTIISFTYTLPFSMLVVSLIDLSLCLKILIFPEYIKDIVKPEFIGMALSLPVLCLLVNLLQAVEKHKRAKVASELAFLQYSIEGLDSSTPAMTEESRIRRGVDIIQEVNKSMRDLLALLRHSLNAHSALFLQIVSDSDKAIIRAYDSASKLFTTERQISLESSIYQFAISKHSSFQKQSDTPLNKSLGYYVSEIEVVKSVLVVPVIESALVVGIVLVDSLDKKLFSQAEIDLIGNYADFIMKQLIVFRTLKESDEKAAQFQLLSHISKELMQSLKLTEILDRLIDYCSRAAPFDGCLLALRQDNTLELMIQRGFDNALPAKIKMGQSKNWMEWFLANREEPLLLNDLHTTKMPLWHIAEKAKQWKEVYALPLIMKSKVIGVLLFASNKNDIFRSHVRTMLTIIASQASFIIENARLYEKTEFQAITDGLTEVPNHRHFQEILMNYMKSAKDTNTPISLLITDIDYFKKINDTYGHQFGDKVLKKIAQVLKMSIRNDDFIARYGGEEFAIILNECNENDAHKVAEKMRKRVQKNTWDFNKQKISVTISTGIASFPKQANTKDDLIKKADTALYKAKGNGRNRVEIFE